MTRPTKTAQQEFDIGLAAAELSEAAVFYVEHKDSNDEEDRTVYWQALAEAAVQYARVSKLAEKPKNK